MTTSIVIDRSYSNTLNTFRLLLLFNVGCNQGPCLQTTDCLFEPIFKNHYHITTFQYANNRDNLLIMDHELVSNL